mmetsp:Transcript_2492/g.4248  ORF Transcript_2492/g.4248 Transcript_2492/m.4248 type:complete len:183 (-) Transcript_2492:135-683(-)
MDVARSLLDELMGAERNASTGSTGSGTGSIGGLGRKESPPVQNTDSNGAQRTTYKLEVNSIGGECVSVLHVGVEQLVAEVKRELAKDANGRSWTLKLMVGGEIIDDDTRTIGSYIDFEGGQNCVTLIRTGAFVPAGAFEGEPELGYVFKNGEHGLGYYKDEYEDCDWKRWSSYGYGGGKESS